MKLTNSIVAASLCLNVNASDTKAKTEGSLIYEPDTMVRMLSTEMRLTINDYLTGPKIFAFAYTCTALRDEFLSVAEKAVSGVIP